MFPCLVGVQICKCGNKEITKKRQSRTLQNQYFSRLIFLDKVLFDLSLSMISSGRVVLSYKRIHRLKITLILESLRRLYYPSSFENECVTFWLFQHF